MGNLHRWGRGPVSPNAVQAYVWYTLAGDTNFAPLFKEQLASEMTYQEIEEAERLAAEWQPNPTECETILANRAFNRSN